MINRFMVLPAVVDWGNWIPSRYCRGNDAVGKGHAGGRYTPPGLGVKGEEGGAEEGGGHEVGDVARQAGVAVAGRQRGAQHEVRRREVLHDQQTQRGVEVVQLWDVLGAVPRLLSQRLRLKPRPLLRASHRNYIKLLA